jgi:hypothetical protein
MSVVSPREMTFTRLSVSASPLLSLRGFQVPEMRCEPVRPLNRGFADWVSRATRPPPLGGGIGIFPSLGVESVSHKVAPHQFRYCQRVLLFIAIFKLFYPSIQRKYVFHLLFLFHLLQSFIFCSVRPVYCL